MTPLGRAMGVEAGTLAMFCFFGCSLFSPGGVDLLYWAKAQLCHVAALLLGEFCLHIEHTEVLALADAPTGDRGFWQHLGDL